MDRNLNATIHVNELTLDKIRPNAESIKTTKGGSKIIVIGKPGSGKSVLIKDLIYSKRHLIPVGVAISGSEESNKFYEGIFPSPFIYESYDKSILEKLKERQKIAKDNLKAPANSWALLVVDDCMDDTRIFKDPVMVGLFKNGRHWNVLTIFASQYCMDTPPSIRTNIDGVFIFRDPNVTNREKIWKNFASVIPTMALFNELMNQLTTDFTAIYIDNQATSNDWTECVFYYRATQRPDFKFGCADYWTFAHERADD